VIACRIGIFCFFADRQRVAFLKGYIGYFHRPCGTTQIAIYGFLPMIALQGYFCLGFSLAAMVVLFAHWSLVERRPESDQIQATFRRYRTDTLLFSRGYHVDRTYISSVEFYGICCTSIPKF
jgi:hypothetical protein